MERIPIFPLNAVVFPGEYFNLHIFEPRYKQLIADIELSKSTFGIPFTDEKGPIDYGSEVRLHKILKTHQGGELDITVEGVGIFQIEAKEDPDDGKLYNSGLVRKREETPSSYSSNELSLLLHEYLALGNNQEAFQKSDAFMYAYEAGILLGLYPSKKYRLIQCETEQKRQIWMCNELKLLIQTRKMELQLDRKFILN